MDNQLILIFEMLALVMFCLYEWLIHYQYIQLTVEASRIFLTQNLVERYKSPTTEKLFFCTSAVRMFLHFHFLMHSPFL